jgi:L-ascorbate metabolism protein UlaG (beta-lactamase superfamily)
MKKLGLLVCCLSVGWGWVCAVDAVSITSVAGSGYVFRDGDLAISIDAHASYGTSGEMQDMMATGTPPYDLDIILVTHSHHDHFDSGLVAANMLASAGSVLVGPEDVIAQVRDQAPEIAQDRLMAVVPASDEPVVVEVHDVQLTVLLFPHPPRGLPVNVGYLFEFGSVVFFHPGDLDVNRAGELFETYGLNAGAVEVAILPAFMFSDTGLHDALWGLEADCFLPTHVRPIELASACRRVTGTFPNALCFHELMEEKEYMAGTPCEPAP